MYDIVYRKKER